jgi:hypothetical protein
MFATLIKCISGAVIPRMDLANLKPSELLSLHAKVADELCARGIAAVIDHLKT